MKFCLLLFLTILSVVVAQPPPPGGLIAGGFEDLKPGDFADRAWKSAEKINAGINGNTWFVPIKVLKARTQVVAGTNTELEVLVGESSCSKTTKISEVTVKNCQFKKGGSRAVFKVSIWEKPWEKFEQVTAEKIRDVGAAEII